MPFFPTTLGAAPYHVENMVDDGGHSEPQKPWSPSAALRDSFVSFVFIVPTSSRADTSHEEDADYSNDDVDRGLGEGLFQRQRYILRSS